MIQKSLTATVKNMVRKCSRTPWQGDLNLTAQRITKKRVLYKLFYSVQLSVLTFWRNLLPRTSGLIHLIQVYSEITEKRKCVWDTQRLHTHHISSSPTSAFTWTKFSHLEDEGNTFLQNTNTYLPYTRDGQFHPAGGPHNSLRPCLRATLVHTYIESRREWSH